MGFEEKFDKLHKLYLRVLHGPTNDELKEFVKSFHLFENYYESVAVAGYLSSALRIPGIKPSMMALLEFSQLAKKFREHVDSNLSTGLFNRFVESENNKIPTTEEVKELLKYKKIIANNALDVIWIDLNDASILKSIDTDIVIHENNMVDVNVTLVADGLNYITSLMVGEISSKEAFEKEIKSTLSSLLRIQEVYTDNCYKINIDINFES